MWREYRNYTVTLALAVVASFAQAADEDFSADPNWTGSNNTSSGNSYGYRAAATDAGGTFARAAVDSFYGDTSLSKTFDLTDVITGSGKFEVREISEGWTGSGAGRVFIGHFSSNADDEHREFIGLEIENHDEESVNVRARFQVPGGTRAADSDPLTVTANTPHTFQYTYDPHAGDEGDTTPDGRLTVIIDEKTIVVNLSGHHRTSGAEFDAFGMGYTNNRNTQSGEDKTAQVVIDDVSYSGR